MTSLTFKLPTELRAALEKAAKADGRTLSDYIRRHFSGLLRRKSKPTPRKGAK